MPTTVNKAEPVIGQTSGQLRRWLPVALLFLLFAAPMIAAYLWRPSPDDPTINYGELITPARPPIDIPMQTLKGEKTSFATLQGKWTLLYVGGDSCDKICKDNLYKIERVRLTQGKNLDRVQSIYLAPTQIAADTVRERLDSYVGITGMQISDSTKARISTYFEQDGHGPLQRRIYYIDPLGNLMMSYPADADPTGMRKDLARLLKASQIG